MDEEQFSLCWNNFYNNLSSGFHTLLQDEDFVDVTLSAEGKFLKAHKAVLSVCSPFFKNLFRGNPCDHPVVILQGIKYAALCSLLQFMYQGEVSVTQEEITSFMLVAETLQIKGLTEENTPAKFSGENGLVERNSEQDIGRRPKCLKRPILSTLESQPAKVGTTELSHKLPKTSQRPTDFKGNDLKGLDLKGADLKATELINEVFPILKNASMKADVKVFEQKHFTEVTKEFTRTLSKPKDEPVDSPDFNTSESSENTLDPLSLGEHEGSWDDGSFPRQNDVSTPGTLQCILGRRGNPRLIVDGHVFYKKSTYKGKAFWYCKNSRTPEKCQAVCWTLNGNIIKWPYVHNHSVFPDVFNPEEDTEVPIEKMQEVLWHTSL